MYIRVSWLRQLKQWTQFNHGEMTIMEAMEHLNSLIDESDPDVSRTLS